MPNFRIIVQDWKKIGSNQQHQLCAWNFFLINLIALSAFIDLLIQFEIWSAHWSFESKITPRTFIFLFEVTIFPYKLSEIGVESPLWNRHRSVLDSLTFIPESFNQSIIFLSFNSISFIRSDLFLFQAKGNLSSAKHVKFSISNRMFECTDVQTSAANVWMGIADEYLRLYAPQLKLEKVFLSGLESQSGL